MSILSSMPVSPTRQATSCHVQTQGMAYGSLPLAPVTSSPFVAVPLSTSKPAANGLQGLHRFAGGTDANSSRHACGSFGSWHDKRSSVSSAGQG